MAPLPVVAVPDVIVDPVVEPEPAVFATFEVALATEIEPVVEPDPAVEPVFETPIEASSQAAIELVAPPATESGLSLSPTITSPAMTMGGVILGTAAYMSPEQAKGKPVDRRTDMWAFGCVLFEMLTGKRPFGGDDVSDTLATILKSDPDLRTLPSELPASLSKLIRRCLAKDRRARLSDAAVARLEIEEAMTRGGDSPASASGDKSIFRRMLVPVGSALAAGVAVALMMWTMRPAEPLRPVRRFTLELPPETQFGGAARRLLALSPDGSRLVFAASQRLNLRSMDSLEVKPLQGTSAAVLPFFSPDGKSIGFWQDGRLKRMDISGGPAIVICETTTPFGASWEEDGTILFARGLEGIWKVAEEGGQPVQIVSVDSAKGEFAESPQLLPGNKAVMFTVNMGLSAGSTRAALESSQIAVQTLATGARRTVLQGAADGRYVHTGHIVHVRQGALVAVPFDVRRLMVTGGSIALIEKLAQASSGGGVSPGGFSTVGQYSLSRNRDTRLYAPAWCIPRAHTRLGRPSRTRDTVGRLLPDHTFIRGYLQTGPVWQLIFGPGSGYLCVGYCRWSAEEIDV